MTDETPDYSDLWVTPEDELLTVLWADMPISDDVTATVLRAAQRQCADYAPRLAEDATVPDNYRLALVMQARAVHRSFLAGSGDQIGPDGLTVTVYPMDRSVKALLRPSRPRGPQ